jgi:hypothetical protein
MKIETLKFKNMKMKLNVNKGKKKKQQEEGYKQAIEMHNDILLKQCAMTVCLNFSIKRGNM